MSTLPRLNSEALAALPKAVERPGYDRSKVEAGVAHIGPGAFHRAHQAVVFDDILRLGDLRWGVTGLSLRSPAPRDALQSQDGLYTLSISEGSQTRRRVIGSIREVIALDASPIPIVQVLAEPSTRLVTLTITEAGYEPPAHRRPPTAAGLLAAALLARRTRGLPGLTILACDNLEGAGRRMEELVCATAAAIDPDMPEWIEANARFPGCMVDRITPATSEADIEAFGKYAGIEDRALVRTEAFSQWVIEDRFAGPRPDFESVGVQVVADVAPFSRAKLRLLNGAHSAMAYLGGLAGLTFVHEFAHDPAGAAFVERLWDEAEATLEPAAGLDLVAYRMRLMARFRDPAIAHRLAQIAIDGSLKLPPRLVSSLAVRTERGLPSPGIVLAIAAWIRWQAGRDDAGAPVEARDAGAGALRRRLARLSEPEARVRAMLHDESMVPAPLAANEPLRAALVEAVRRLDTEGARAALSFLE
ncbi:MAG TPA: mannitol dehydrogenase family protein [Caulobacteraceae bacterium]|nr:mannitol dehydrogenase family protein [Caulobacteraceae bacterium]